MRLSRALEINTGVFLCPVFGINGELKGHRDVQLDKKLFCPFYKTKSNIRRLPNVPPPPSICAQSSDARRVIRKAGLLFTGKTAYPADKITWPRQMQTQTSRAASRLKPHSPPH